MDSMKAASNTNINLINFFSLDRRMQFAFWFFRVTNEKFKMEGFLMEFSFDKWKKNKANECLITKKNEVSFEFVID